MPDLALTPDVSPPELAQVVLSGLLLPEQVPGGIVTGGANDAQQEQGCIAIMDAGGARIDHSQALMWKRLQFRCLAVSLDQAEGIGTVLRRALEGVHRVVVRQPSNDTRYLVHAMTVVGGPSTHFDSPETFEALVFAEMSVGLDPVGG